MSIADHFSIRRMPTGRLRFLLRQMRKRAEAEGLPVVVSRADHALEKGRHTAGLELRWAEVRNASSARGKASLIDNKIDEQIVAIEGRVDSDSVGESDHPRVIAAKEVLSKIFPDGPAAITRRSFEDQLSVMDAMMERFEDDMADHVVTLGLTDHLTRLSGLIERFRKELKKDDEVTVSYDQVKASRNELHELVCKVVTAVYYHLDKEDEATVRKRTRILAPLQFQQKRVGEARRRHRVPTDIDPETGEEVIDEAEDPTDSVEPVEPNPEPAPMES